MMTSILLKAPSSPQSKHGLHFPAVARALLCKSVSFVGLSQDSDTKLLDLQKFPLKLKLGYYFPNSFSFTGLS